MRVILADDEQKVCQLIYDLVHWEDYGMTVVGMAYNGLDTLDLIKKQRPDLVITDIKMPGCDGTDPAGKRLTGENGFYYHKRIPFF